MPKGRRAYYKQPSSIWRDNLSNDELAALARLQGYLEERWARDGIPDEEAGRAEISLALVVKITGKGRRDVAAMSLRHLADIVSMSVEIRGDVASIYWPKFAEYQHNFGRFAREKGPPHPRPASASASSSSHSSSHKSESEVSREGGVGGKPAPAAPPPPRDKKPAAPKQKPSGQIHPPPANLTPEQTAELEEYARTTVPSEVSDVRRHIAECLEWHRAAGRKKWKADYLATCRLWISRAPDLRRSGPAPPRSANGSRPEVTGSDWAARREAAKREQRTTQ